jgi:hypothetical protein
MSETILVSSSLVRYLRRGIRSQFGFAAERLATCLLEFDDDPADEYERSLQAFQAAHALHSQLNAAGNQPSSSIEIDIASSALLVLRALECQYNTELDRLQEAGLYGQNSDAARDELQALGDLVVVVNRHVQRQGDDRTELFPQPPISQVRTHGRRRKQTLTCNQPRR